MVASRLASYADPGDDCSTSFTRGPMPLRLGLSLVRAAAERHGGRLEIAGPRFAIVLPALMPLSGPSGHDAVASQRRHP